MSKCGQKYVLRLILTGGSEINSYLYAKLDTSRRVRELRVTGLLSRATRGTDHWLCELREMSSRPKDWELVEYKVAKEDEDVLDIMDAL